MKTITIAFALVLLLMLAPVVSAEETFNPSTGKWENIPDTDPLLEDPYGNQLLNQDPDDETGYDPYQDFQDQQQPQDEPWSDAFQEDLWDQEPLEEGWSDSDEDVFDQEPPPDEAFPETYGDQWDQQQPPEDSWSYPSESEDRSGPPPWVKMPPGGR
jgi:hypothetical protein